MLNFSTQNHHLYIEALFHALLSEQESWKTINDALGRHYDNIRKVYSMEDDTDRAYILDTNDKLIIAISGTKSKKGWVRDFLCWTDNGWHYGFRRSFKNFLLNPFMYALKEFKGDKIYIFGHSAGPAIGLNLNYFIRSTIQRNCESIGFCMPQTVNSKGRQQCKKSKVCHTSINVGWRDQVDDVAKFVGGVNYGCIIELPDAGVPSADRKGFIDDVFIGHAPSYVCESLKKQFNKWYGHNLNILNSDMNYIKVINEISKYAIL